MHLLLILGAALVGLPILIHLILKQEPKRLPFPALRFLQAKKRTTTRKLKLRHFLLMALRMLLIALFALALFQPKIPSNFADLGLDFGEGRAVAAVIIVDTTPSMAYTTDKKTRLEEAVRRAVELVDRLPASSRVAVLTTTEPNATWEVSPADARRKLEGIKQPDGVSLPVTSVLPSAWQLFASLDADAGSQGTEPLPKLVAIFTDRTAEAWKTDRTADLQAGLERIALPKPVLLVFDVGVESPANVSILAAEVRPAIAPSGAVVTVSVTLQATGVNVPASRVKCRMLSTGETQTTDVALAAGVPTPTSLTFRDLKPGWHQAEITLETPDNLGPDGVPGFDNVRYTTFKIGASRKLLTISDEPSDAAFWKLAHQQKNDIACEVMKPEDVRDLGGYDVVCLLSVTDPAKVLKDGESLWAKLKPYVERGGKLLIIPGGLDQITLASYDPNGPAAGVMPAKLVRTLDAQNFADEDRKLGVSWALTDDALKHPFMMPFRDWKLSGKVDFLQNPRKAWKFWEVEASPESIVVNYDDTPDAAKRKPAVLEKSFPTGGKVLLLTSRMDSPWDAERRWHNYYETTESSWAVVFPNLLVKYLAGDSAEGLFQFNTGRQVSVPLPRGDAAKGKKLLLEGPGVNPDDATLKLETGASEWRLSPERNRTPGNFVIRTEDRSWEEAFSLNIPAEESTLTKVEVDAIQTVTGPDTVISVGKDFDLTTMLAGRNAEVSLLPWLLIGVLLLFAAEGVLANRFYGLRKSGR
jgi:Aerotolerance regulator N-terminal